MEFKEYLKSYKNYFWQYEDNASWVVVRDGHTIMHMDFALEVLSGLTEFPRWGTLLLGVAATDENAARALNKIQEHFESAITWDKADLDMMDNAFMFLNALHALPAAFRTGERRIHLLQFLLSGTHRSINQKDSKHIHYLLTAGVYRSDLMRAENVADRRVCVLDVRWYSILASRYPSMEDLISAMNQIPDAGEHVKIPIESETKDSGKARDKFVDELIEEPRTFHAGVLIRQIWAGINIPFHNELPSRQPIGGVSDLTNKGDYDKLLISEFANDDIIFLSRLANNEALFLNREIPPENNQHTRIFLIDVSLRNWGNPRSIGFAVSIAIARHLKASMPYRCFAFGEVAEEVFLDSTIGIANALDAISPAHDSGKGLRSFFESGYNEKDDELFIITTKEAASQPGMMKVIQEYGDKLRYYIFTDHEGSLDIFKRRGKNRTLIQHLRLDLNEMQKTPPTKTSQKSRDRNYVEIPFYVRPDSHIQELIETENGGVFLRAQSRSVYQMEEHVVNVGKGLRILPEKLPREYLPYAIGQSDDGNVYYCSWKAETRLVQILNLLNGTEASCQLPFDGGRTNMKIHFSENAFFLFEDSGWRVDLKGNCSRADEQVFKLKDLHAKLRRQNVKSWKHRTPLLNILSVMISEDERLFISGHELVVRGNGGVYLQSFTTHPANALIAEQELEEFLFQDGSLIKKLVGGVLLFKSSSAHISDFFMTADIEKPLVLATDTVFAGDSYCLRELSRYQITMVECRNVLAATEVLVRNFPFYAETIRANENIMKFRIPDIHRAEHARRIATELTEAGARVSTRTLTEDTTQRISPKEFFANYIQPFISHIYTHAH